MSQIFDTINLFYKTFIENIQFKYFSLDIHKIIRDFLYIFVIIIIVLYVVYVLYFKIKYPFWAKQPVFHFHNIKQWIYPSGVIYKDGKFPINKYYVPYEVSVKRFDDESINTIKPLFYELIRSHYMTSKDSSYKPSDEKINAYFIGHNNPCFISYINKPRISYNIENNDNDDNSDNTGIVDKIVNDDIVCALTSRPVHMYFNDKNSENKDNYFLMNYVDFLCTHKNERKKGCAPKTIYTYAIDSQKTSPNTNVFLFKREGTLNAIVPITTFSTYMYNLKYWKKETLIKPYELIEITDSNFNIIQKSMDIQNLKNYFSLVGISDLTNIYELIKNGCIKVYGLTIPKTNFIFSLYFFKDNDVITFEDGEKSIQKNEDKKDFDKDDKGDKDKGDKDKDDKEYNNINKVIDCVGSIFFDNNFSDKLDVTEKKALFEIGFNCCVNELKKMNYKSLFIENISHNNIFLKNIFLQKQYIMNSPTAYFFYNYAHYPFMENEVFFLF